jgi:hypothetical protein
MEMLALRKTPNKIYSPPINADERRWEAVGFKLSLRGTTVRIQALSYRQFNPVQPGQS